MKGGSSRDRPFLVARIGYDRLPVMPERPLPEPAAPSFDPEAFRRHWQRENREAVEAWNAWVAKHGLPLARFRQF
jgi:LPS sulfotransferase NodH